MQCARCGAMLPVNASSCPVCAEPVANLVPQATPSLEPMLQAANQSAGAPEAPAPPSPASYGVFSFTEFGGAASSQAGQPPSSPMPAPGQFVPPGAAKKGPSVGIIIFSICLIVLLLGTGIAAFTYISARSGKIGLFAEDSTQPTEIAFSNAKVWTL